MDCAGSAPSDDGALDEFAPLPTLADPSKLGQRLNLERVPANDPLPASTTVP